mmetsp:Transcript_42853/g.80288  ORF Transcript_42853/g.80288 Transcript_42853/m.80288 type:complete len:216 (+) Transcript_42853:849-1496(+)
MLTVSPNRQNRGFILPTTDATTGPEWNPTRIFTQPSSGRSTSSRVRFAVLIASIANSAILLVWSDCSLTRLATAMYASPMVSTLNTSKLRAATSNAWYSRSSMFITFSGWKLAEMSVKPTMSEKKMVTHSWCSGSTFLPWASISPILGGRMSSKILRLDCRPCMSWEMEVSAICCNTAFTSANVGRSAGFNAWHCTASWRTVALQQRASVSVSGW